METTRVAFVCAKCGHNQCETDEFHATGGNFAKFFDVQNKKFTTVSCKQCGYTELYRGDTSMLRGCVTNGFKRVGGV